MSVSVENGITAVERMPPHQGEDGSGLPYLLTTLYPGVALVIVVICLLILPADAETLFLAVTLPLIAASIILGWFVFWKTQSPQARRQRQAVEDALVSLVQDALIPHHDGKGETVPLFLITLKPDCLEIRQSCHGSPLVATYRDRRLLEEIQAIYVDHLGPIGAWLCRREDPTPTFSGGVPPLSAHERMTRITRFRRLLAPTPGSATDL